MTIYQVVLNQVTIAGVMQNVLYYDVNAVTAVDWQDFADTIRSFFKLVEGEFVPTWTLEDITIREDLPNSVGFDQTFTNGALVGTAVAADFAGQLAMLCRKVNSNGRRPALGRMYLGGLNLDRLQADGRWDVVITPLIEGLLGALRTFEFGIDGTAQLMLKASDPSKPFTDAYQQVTSFNVERVPATQKRRRQGVGN